MRYKIRDLQFDDRYFANGAVFQDKKEDCQQLISYHSNDCNMIIEKKLLKAGKIDKCWQSLTDFDWQLKEIS